MSTFQIIKNGRTHPTITYLRMWWLNVFAIIGDSRELWQHVLCGNSNVVEPGVAIICSRPCTQGLDTYKLLSINNPLIAARTKSATYLYLQAVYQVTHCGLLQHTINTLGCTRRDKREHTQRPQLDEKQMRTHILSIRQDKLSLYDSMSRKLPCATNPPFASSECWRVNLEFLGRWDVSCSGL